MRRMATGVSASALLVAWAAAAQAQAQAPGLTVTQMVVDGVGHLLPFSRLLTTPNGTAVLRQNLDTALAINNAATPVQQAQAIHDYTIVSYPLSNTAPTVNLGTVVVDGLGTALSTAYFNAIAANNPAIALKGTLASVFAYGTGISGAIAGTGKYYFGDGDTSGYPLPTLASVGGTENPTGQYYLPSNPWLDPYGDPRPFQVGPLQTPPLTVNIFQGTAFNPPLPGQSVQPGGQMTNAFANSELVDSPSYPSGHTTYAFTQSLMFAIMVPEAYQTQITRASEYGFSRVVMAAHYPLDVIGGRITATYTMAQLLDPANTFFATYQSAFAQATAELRGLLASGCGGLTISACIASGAADRFSDYAANRANYLYRMTYGLPSTGDTTLAPVVPANAYVLLQSRFPYLTPAQITEILYTTEIASGAALDDGSGWARINLFDAAGGYGAFRSTVSVTMDAAKGGLSALDTWSNDITGPGGLIKQGTGTLILSGTNSYLGGTQVQGGTLGVTGTILGAVSIAKDATLSIGPKGIVAANDATAGASTHPTRGAVTNAGTLENSGLITGALLNSGRAANTGTITGDVTNSGTLANNGTIIGAVANGGLLKGTGTITGSLANAGTVAPGNSIGTLSVTGPVTFAPGSIYQVEIGAPGQSDLIAATGPVTINGGNLEVIAGVGAAPTLASYTVITSTSGVNGNFTGVNDPFGSAYPFLNLVTTASGSTLTLSVVADQAALVSAAATPNQAAVAASVATLPSSNAAIQALAGLTSTLPAAAAFDSLSGQIYASAATVLQQQSLYLRDAIGGRLRQATAPADGLSGPAATPLAPGLAVTAWLQGYGAWANNDATSGTSGVSSSVGGVIGGIDAPLGDWRIGIAGGYSQSNFDADTLSSTGSSDNYDLAAYAGGKLAGIDLRLGVAYGWHDLSISRTVAFPGFVNALTSNPKAGTTQVFGEIAKDFALGGATLSPFAGAAYVHFDMDGFTETWGAAALTSSGFTQDNTFTTLGARIAQTIPLGTGQLTGHGSLAWQYAFGDINPQAGLAFAAGSLPFSVSGAPLGRNAALVNVGLDYRATPNMVVGIAYGGQFAGDSHANMLNARLTINF